MSTRVNDAASGTPPVPQAPVEAAPLRRAWTNWPVCGSLLGARADSGDRDRP
ncbi:hypothetical protein [Streptomyces sp. NPDC058295]|uniref:hypothetical protein n=1 Tax=Streptomyces sp. NPDC058295 TaxID=3346431 RepID=UPI0036E43EA0